MAATETAAVLRRRRGVLLRWGLRPQAWPGFTVSSAGDWRLAAWQGRDRLKAGVIAAEQLAGRVEAVRPLLEDALRAVELGSTRYASDAHERTTLRTKLRALLLDRATLDLDAFDQGDDWGRRMWAVASERFCGAANLNDLLLHLAAAGRSRPSERWRKAARTHLEDAEAVAFVRAMLDEVLQAQVLVPRALEGRAYLGYMAEGEWRFDDQVGIDNFLSVGVFLTDGNADLVRGCVWCVGELADDEDVDLLERVFERGLRWSSIKLVNACIHALGTLGAARSTAALVRMRSSVSDRGILKQVERALGEAAARQGISKSELRERLVQEVGLEEGRLELPAGPVSAVVVVDPPGKVTLSWRSANGVLSRTAPAVVREQHADDLRTVRGAVKDVKDALARERRRVEELFVEERHWPVAAWRGRYLDHPLTRALGRRLIWCLRLDGHDKTVLPIDDDGLIDATGDQVRVTDAATVELWHPVGAAVDEVARWRSLLLERELAQPFKQAFREVYYLAPAEEETGTYSNRFAAHIVRYPQAYALIKARGWTAIALGPFDNDGGRNWRDFESYGLRAEFLIEHVEMDDRVGPLSPFASTDQVRFRRLEGREILPLREVPPIVFSEAMRDVDLFVGVSSIAGDPYWRDHGERRFDEYWQRASFGELTETARTRHAVLAEVLPRLRIAGRCELSEKYLVVHGDRRTYRIHLGSGNVLMEPNDEYLCIVPERPASGTSKLFLPFDDDLRLTLILSKAFCSPTTEGSRIGRSSSRSSARRSACPTAPTRAPSCSVFRRRREPGNRGDRRTREARGRHRRNRTQNKRGIAGRRTDRAAVDAELSSGRPRITAADMESCHHVTRYMLLRCVIGPHVARLFVRRAQDEVVGAGGERRDHDQRSEPAQVDADGLVRALLARPPKDSPCLGHLPMMARPFRTACAESSRSGPGSRSRACGTAPWASRSPPPRGT
ncbi:MAG: DUF4132 domain-containing protein [Gaiellaceae bacterium]